MDARNLMFASKGWRASYEIKPANSCSQVQVDAPALECICNISCKYQFTPLFSSEARPTCCRDVARLAEQPSQQNSPSLSACNQTMACNYTTLAAALCYKQQSNIICTATVISPPYIQTCVFYANQCFLSQDQLQT